MKKILFILLVYVAFTACTQKNNYDIIIRNGLIYDGNGGVPYNTDIAINADTIAFIGDLKNATAKNEMDAKGMAVSPGFINMLSWANESLIEDGRSQSDIRQGVT
ncbi:MAG: D-aminoacylase, partial [Chitinophagaceae bacterium]